jgi:acyl-CoA reductase-like NAD-dependent aldehyde dehydrogenase
LEELEVTVDGGTLENNEKRVAELLGREWGLLIDGKVGPAQSGSRFDVWAPSTGARIAQVPDADAADVERAVTAAQNAFPDWRSTTAIQRAQLMEPFARAIEARAEDLALLDSIDGGTPIRITTSDVAAAAMLLRYFAGLVTEIKGVTVPSSANLHYTERVPYGVVARIIPFNHPLMFAVKQLTAPLLAGNTLVLKPAEATPLSALLLGEIAQDLLPPGVLNIVVGDGPQVPSALVSHPAIHRIGFTGSDSTGLKVLQTAAATGFKEVSLELGGKNALIAFPDADPAEVAAGVVTGMNFTWSGQSCGSTSRLLVHEDIADATVDAVLERLGNHVVGNPLDPNSDQGTIATERQYRNIIDYIETAIADGARVVHGGGRPANLETGLFIEPTVLVDVDPYSRIAQEEIFGPVLSVIRWKDPQDAINIANSVRYGLTGSVYTNDIREAHRIARQLDAGVVWINGAGNHFMGLPFGGVKSSGNGREESLDELLSYTQIKSTTVFLN